MAQLRLIGEPDEVRALVDVISTVVHVSDLSPSRSRRNPNHVLLYGHVQAAEQPQEIVTVVRADDAAATLRTIKSGPGTLGLGRKRT